MCCQIVVKSNFMFPNGRKIIHARNLENTYDNLPTEFSVTMYEYGNGN